MAGEIQGSLSVAVRNGNFNDRIVEQFLYDQAGDGGGGPGTIDATTTPAAVTGVGVQGYCFIKNLDTTNNVSYGPSAGNVCNLLPGEFSFFRVSGNVSGGFFISSSAGTVKVLIMLFES